MKLTRWRVGSLTCCPNHRISGHGFGKKYSNHNAAIQSFERPLVSYTRNCEKLADCVARWTKGFRKKQEGFSTNYFDETLAGLRLTKRGNLRSHSSLSCRSWVTRSTSASCSNMNKRSSSAALIGTNRGGTTAGDESDGVSASMLVTFSSSLSHFEAKMRSRFARRMGERWSGSRCSTECEVRTGGFGGRGWPSDPAISERPSLKKSPRLSLVFKKALQLIEVSSIPERPIVVTAVILTRNLCDYLVGERAR